MSAEERNMELMQTLDDAWNAQDLDTFAKRHKEDVVVRWPGKPPTHGSDGGEIPPTGTSFEVDFCTVARWENGQIVEENLFYDLVTFMKQIGLSD